MRLVVGRAGGRRGLCLLLLTGCLILGVLGLGAVEARAATPSSLAGETFTSQHVKGSTLTGSCNEEGGSFSFRVSGAAAGPFPGTFTELGSFTALPDGFLISFSSTFTITSSAGTVTVTGSKTLVGDLSQMVCDDSFVSTVSNFTTSYTATINGTGGDKGAATVNMSGLVGSPRATPVFSETFGSGGVGGPPPTSKAQCKHGGWKSFGTLFKNQGDCVAFVATAGKNPPSGKGSKPSAQYTVCQSGCPYDDLQNAILAVEKGTITNPITVGPGDYPSASVLVRGTVVIRGVGDGSDGTILDGSGNGTVIGVEKPGSLIVSGVEITNGKNDESGGGGIFNDGAAVIFDGPVSITNNAASDGGGIFNDRGTVTFGAGSNVSITGNKAALDGGGIFNHLGTVTFDAGSTVSITGNTPDNCVGTTSCP